MTTETIDASLRIHDVDRESKKYIKNDKDDPSWADQNEPLLISASNFNLISEMRSTGISMDVFLRGLGVEQSHTDALFFRN